jgi:quercetin dioxygenase-like cupin family protein
MERQTTANSQTIDYRRSKAKVDFLDSVSPREGLPPFRVRFTFAPQGEFDSYLHYHAAHSEYLYCEKGRIRVTLGQEEPRWYGPEDGMIEVKPGVPHRWEVIPNDTAGVGGAEGDEQGSGTIVWEHSNPDPELKELFFRYVPVSGAGDWLAKDRNIFSLFNDHNGAPPPLQMMRIFADFDNYPIGPQWWMQLALGYPIQILVNLLGRAAGWIGYKSVYEEYTPEYLKASAGRYGLM